jgi:hypothetical protein
MQSPRKHVTNAELQWVRWRIALVMHGTTQAVLNGGRARLCTQQTAYKPQQDPPLPHYTYKDTGLAGWRSVGSPTTARAFRYRLICLLFRTTLRVPRVST